MRFASIIPLALVVLGMASPSVEAGDVCEKKCYKAKTCAIVGPQCLEFDWCIDPCQGKAATPENKATPAPPDKSSEPLPAPKQI